MSLNFFEYQEVIAKNLLAFIRSKGYSKLSLSKLTDISRPTIDQILKGDSPNPTTFNSQIKKINQAFELPDDYLITDIPIVVTTAPLAYAYSDRGSDQEKSPLSIELLDGLDNILDVFSMYMK